MCMYLIDMFQVSHKAIQPNQNTVSLLLSVCLFVCCRLFSCCTYVAVYFRHKKGKPGRVSKGGKGRGKVG